MNRRWIAAGVGTAVLYVLVTQLSFRVGLFPARPLYDGGGPPPPYRWVNPPPELKRGNTPPVSAAGTTPIGSKESPNFFATTDDNQASVIFPPGGIAVVPSQSKVTVTVKPLDPATLGPPPAGYDYDGNAYSITGVYLPSKKPIQLPPAKCSVTNFNICATVQLRYAFNATALFLMQGSTWTKVPSQASGSALLIVGSTDKLGIFVAVDPHSAGGPKGKSQTGNIIAFVIGLAAILLGTFAARLRASRKRRARAAARQKKGTKPVSPKPKSKPKKPGKAERQQRKEESEDKPWWRD